MIPQLRLRSTPYDPPAFCLLFFLHNRALEPVHDHTYLETRSVCHPLLSSLLISSPYAFISPFFHLPLPLSPSPPLFPSLPLTHLDWLLGRRWTGCCRGSSSLWGSSCSQELTGRREIRRGEEGRGEEGEGGKRREEEGRGRGEEGRLGRVGRGEELPGWWGKQQCADWPIHAHAAFCKDVNMMIQRRGDTWRRGEGRGEGRREGEKGRRGTQSIWSSSWCLKQCR